MSFSMMGGGKRRFRLHKRRGYSKAELMQHNAMLMEKIKEERTQAAMEIGKRNAAVQVLTRELRKPLWTRALQGVKRLFGGRRG